jgi:hypothetical protein
MITNVKEFGSLLSEGGGLLLSAIKAGRKISKMLDQVNQMEKDSIEQGASNQGGETHAPPRSSCSDEPEQMPQSSLHSDNKPSNSKQKKAGSMPRQDKSSSWGSESMSSGSSDTRVAGVRGFEGHVMSIPELKREIVRLGYDYRCKNLDPKA